MTKKELLNKVYSQNKLYKFVASQGKVLLGIHIKKINPQSKKEWEDYCLKEKLVDKFSKVMITNFKYKKFNKYKELLDLITKKDVYKFASKLIIDNQFKGYQNELIAQQYFIDKGFDVYDTTYKDDVLNSIDFHIVKDYKKGGVSVKSGGWAFQTTNYQQNKLKKKLFETAKKYNYHRCYLIVVNNKQQIKYLWIFRA